VRSMGTILGSVYFQLVTKRPLGSFPFDFLSLGVGKGFLCHLFVTIGRSLHQFESRDSKREALSEEAPKATR